MQPFMLSIAAMFRDKNYQNRLLYYRTIQKCGLFLWDTVYSRKYVPVV